jgi:hypothetical protein
VIEVARDVCAFCHRPIIADLDEDSMLDWSDNGDYGCGSNPLNDEEGTGGHIPSTARSVLFTQEVQGAWHVGRGPEYVEEAKRLAERLELWPPS